MNQPILSQPTYYVRHPDDSYSVADPQPTLAPSRDSTTPSEGQQAARSEAPAGKPLTVTWQARRGGPWYDVSLGSYPTMGERLDGLRSAGFEILELHTYVAGDAASPPEAQPAEQRKPRPLDGRCAADSDGDCTHPDCPQLRDGEPEKTGRSCPIHKDPEYS